MKICIYGSASDLIADIYKEQVYKLGQELARRGHSLVFGGGANGLMGAAARGFNSENGEILGIIPKFFGDNKIEDSYDKCTELVLTEEMYERKRLLEENADAFIITPGGIGTYDEFFAVLTNKQLGRHTKPIAMFNVNGYYNEIKNVMDSAIEQHFVKAKCATIYEYFTENQVSEMIEYIEKNQHGAKISDLKDG